MADKWVYSFNESYFTSYHYDSKDDAVADGIEEAKEMEEGLVHVGRLVPLKMSNFAPDGCFVVEHCVESAYDIVGDIMNRWGDNILRKDVNKLTSQIKLLLDSWADEHNYQPTFFAIEDVETHEVEDAQ